MAFPTYTQHIIKLVRYLQTHYVGKLTWVSYLCNHRTTTEVLISFNQTCKQSNRSNRKVIDWSQLRCNSNRLKFFKCNSNRLRFYLLHLLLSIIFLLQFTLCYFSSGGCRKRIQGKTPLGKTPLRPNPTHLF